MTNEEIKQLEAELRGAAEYKDPVLGLILLRYAQDKLEEEKTQIEERLSINLRTGNKRHFSENFGENFGENNGIHSRQPQNNHSGTS